VQSPVTFTATVTSMYGVIPDGEVVTFYDGTTQIGSGTTSGKVATFTTSALPVATHTIKATYSGDATFKSSSGTVKQVVNPATTCPTETSTGKIPLNDLGTGTYQGFTGGLYPNGSNVRPDAHTQAGMAQAATIQPLDANGNPSPTGKIAIAAIGNSIRSAGFGDFKNNRFPKSLHNPAVVPVNTTVGGTFLGSGPNSPTNPNSTYWTAVQTTLTNANLTMAQVQVAVVYEFMCCYALESKPFPADAQKQYSALITLMQTIEGKFPNLKLVYVMTREYGGYQTQCTAQEPYAYETGFAYQWLVADQIAGDPALNFDPTNGLVMSAWISWGPYMWADGVIPRSDGLTWLLSDYASDGFHLSALGAAKDGKAILNVFETDSTAISWFQ
jgi:Bacterial Ig-like domain (group 3)